MKKQSIAILAILANSIFLSGCSSELVDTGKYVSLAQCMTTNGAVMYGTNWCTHCSDQKALFGKKSFAEINFVDCDQEKNKCGMAGVVGYPTRIINGQKLEGTQTLEKLAEVSKCSM